MEQLQHASATEPTVEIRWPRPGIAQVVLGGEHDLSTVAGLKKTFSEMLPGCSKLIVDLRDTQYIDASTIGALVTARRRAEASGREFSLVLATTPIVERALEISGVLPELNRLHTVGDALRPRPFSLEVGSREGSAVDLLSRGSGEVDRQQPTLTKKSELGASAS
jgi:anti-anti-sigma factor